ncbi:MAG: hypothetical protein R3F61_34800 [Myxococcota bacterium]
MRAITILCVLGLTLACGGTPVTIQVGDTRIDVGEATPEAAPSGSRKTGSKPAPSTAPAQIQISTNRGILPQVDGVPMTATADGYFLEVAPGKREIVVFNLLGTRKGQKTVQVSGGRRHVFGWDGKTVSDGGERAASPLPKPIVTTGSVVITGLLVSDPGSVVVIAGQTATRQSDGTFRAEGIAGGRQSVRITAGGFDLYDGPVDVGWGGETRCSFVLGSGAWVPDCRHHP